jgi:hypothetical protein
MTVTTPSSPPTPKRLLQQPARPLILELTGKTKFDDAYFTQTLLPDYITAHPEECEKWDVIFDARGRLREPHTGLSVPLGTAEDRSYSLGRPLVDWGTSISGGDEAYPTHGPENPFKNVLFIEKEGFDQLLDRAQIAEKYDLAIMSTKGVSVTAARKLLDDLSKRGVENVFVLYDFDISGFTIAGTLTTSSRRYQFHNAVKIIDIGLRLADVEGWRLENEPVAIPAKEWPARSATLRKHGATPQEIAFLSNRRVELNALTSPQFIEHLERKLTEHGAAKVIPDDAVLERHWRGVRLRQLLEGDFEAIKLKAIETVATMPAPTNLAGKVAALIEKTPWLSWDEAVAMIEKAAPL